MTIINRKLVNFDTKKFNVEKFRPKKQISDKFRP